MSVRTSLATLAVVALALSPLVVLSSATAAPPGYTEPARIPGSAGLANPVSATTPDGADLLLWGVPAGGTTNTYKARLRLPGRAHWAKIPGPFKQKNFGGVSDIATTEQGDFWITWVSYQGDVPTTFVQRLDTSKATWTKARRVFHQDGYGFGGAVLDVAGNGTLLVGAYAQDLEPFSPPRYRVIVATKFAGKKWRERFLTAADGFAAGVTVDANPKGELVTSWIQGYALGTKTVAAATHKASAKAPWKKNILSTAGDSQSAQANIGPDGTAAVIWTAPDQSPSAVRLATKEVRRPLSPWLFTDVVTGTQFTSTARAVVNKNGDVTALWIRSSGANTVLWSRQVSNGVAAASAVQLSPDVGLASISGAELGTDGDVRVLFHRYSAGPSNEGLRLGIVDGGALVDTLELTDAGDGSANGDQLGLEAAARPNLVWTRGDYPDTDFAWLGVDDGSGGPRPVLMTNARSGSAVNHVKAKGVARVGRTLTCKTGLWVEAAETSVSWYRNGNYIAGSSGREYQLVRADRGTNVRCDAFAAGHDLVVRVKGVPRTVS